MNQTMALVPAGSLENEERLSWYWWFRGKYLSDTPESFRPTSNDPLEKIAWASIKYDHLGGPNTDHVLLTHVKQGHIENPNNAWDTSKTAAPLMRRVFHFNNLLHFITVLLNFAVLMPLTSTYILTSSSDVTRNKSLIQYFLFKIKQRLGV